MTGKKLRKIIQWLLLMCYILKKEEKMDSTYVSKHNSKYKKEITLLPISNQKGWHYIAVKTIRIVIRNITKKRLFLLSELSSFI